MAIITIGIDLAKTIFTLHCDQANTVNDLKSY